MLLHVLVNYKLQDFENMVHSSNLSLLLHQKYGNLQLFVSLENTWHSHSHVGKFAECTGDLILIAGVAGVARFVSLNNRPIVFFCCCMKFRGWNCD